MKKNIRRFLGAGAYAALLSPLSVMAQSTTSDPQAAIVTAGTTIAGYAGAAAAAGVLIMVVIMGVRKAKSGLKAGS